jgi:hypothetical protein
MAARTPAPAGPPPAGGQPASLRAYYVAVGSAGAKLPTLVELLEALRADARLAVAVACRCGRAGAMSGVRMRAAHGRVWHTLISVMTHPSGICCVGCPHPQRTRLCGRCGGRARQLWGLQHRHPGA